MTHEVIFMEFVILNERVSAINEENAMYNEDESIELE
ncbi:pantocin A family RiPP [Providencia sp. PROV188]|nr:MULTISPECIES: pantocin A family RiPP [Providencia]MBC5791402.1 pantocin A family RiPP [Providencia sp. JUb39]MTB66431.1 pantocin A family RiPP [Providencia sp. wls1943]MTC46346.1 pantocin A family RiPP [Providencia sp. wls1922]MBG5882968.1 pantocin A family RiPP [Providencia alcalifaciens]MDR2242171.1 pantocin A family RiPP [Providencia alcalifaciens]